MKPTVDHPSSKPSLEALLRLKREERPDALFWSDFEVRLRQRQLAAIIEPKPWWLGVSIALRRLSLPALLAAPAAAAVLALVIMRGGAPVQEPGFAAAPPGQSASAQTSVGKLLVADVAPPIGLSETPAMEVVQSGLEPVESVIVNAAVRSALSVGTSLNEAAPAFVSDQAAPKMASSEEARFVGNTDPEAARLAATDSTTPSVEDVVGALARVDSAAGELSAQTSSSDPVVSFEFEPRDVMDFAWLPESMISPDYAFGVSASGDDLAALAVGFGTSVETTVDTDSADAIAPAPGSRFERLLSADTPKVASTSGALAQVRDRVLHHLGRDEELYASAGRLGVGGDRLSLRF